MDIEAMAAGARAGGGGASGGGGRDPSFANVGLLLHFDGTNGATTFIDSSSHGRSCTATGSVSLTTAQQKFGTASLSSGGASNYAVTANSTDWIFGSGQFTVEAFIRPTASIAGFTGVVTVWTSIPNLAWFLGFNGTTLAFFYSTTGSDNPSVGAVYTPTQNSWMHIAADRDASNVLRVYADGVVVASATVAATFSSGSSTNLAVGNDLTGGRAFTGQIDEVRVTKGVARYAGAFTPPIAPFPNQ